MQKKNIQVWVDWSKSFVDPEGNFYCGTTEQQKETAVSVSNDADLYLYLCDVHPRTSSEFSVNGGLYPAHNVVQKDQYELDELGVPAGKSVSPKLTEKLQDIVKEMPSGLIVPRHVFLQDYDGGEPTPCFAYRDVEETFGIPSLNECEFLDDGAKYVINAKHMFNGAAMQHIEVDTRGQEWLDMYYMDYGNETSIFSLLKAKHGQGKDIEFNLTGVVMGICVYQTASGIKQIFPKSNVNIIADGATHLLIPQLGFADSEYADRAIKSMCQQIGVNYIKSSEYIGRY